MDPEGEQYQCLQQKDLLLFCTSTICANRNFGLEGFQDFWSGYRGLEETLCAYEGGSPPCVTDESFSEYSSLDPGVGNVLL